MWYRVFGLQPLSVSPASLTAHLHQQGLSITPHFKANDLGWTRGELTLVGGGTPIILERYLTVEDELRPDLNNYAAELETMSYSENSPRLMQHMIQTQQLITLRKPIDHADEATLETVLETACQFLASHTDGVYQVDGQGWFAADGTKLVQEY